MSYTAVEAAKIITNNRNFSSRKIRASAYEEVAKPSIYTILIPLKNERALTYNTNTQTFALWESNDLAIWEEIRSKKLRLGVTKLKPFVRAGYVVEQSANEHAEVRSQYEKFRFDKANMLLTIAPTLSCNFGCSYCFQGLDKPVLKMKDDVKTALIEMYVNKIEETSGIFVTWYGGEPLMDKKSIYALSDEFMLISEEAKKPYSAFIVTNGYFLDRRTADELVKRKVTMAQITIDGEKDAHDSRRHLTSGRPTYDRILQNIEDVITNTDLKITVRVNIDSQNSPHVKALLEELGGNDFAKSPNFSVYFAPVEAITSECASCSDESMGKTDYSTLEVQMLELAANLGLSGVSRPPKFMGTCTAVRPNGMVITPNGDIHKCWDTVMNRNQSVGTIFEYNSMHEHSLHKKWMDWTPFDNPTCNSCKLLPACMGGCAFKFIHADRTQGEAGALPCPSWKFNVAEKLFLRAKRMGIVTQDDWDEENSPTTVNGVSKTGNRHTFSSIKSAADKIQPAILEIV